MVAIAIMTIVHLSSQAKGAHPDHRRRPIVRDQCVRLRRDGREGSAVLPAAAQQTRKLSATLNDYFIARCCCTTDTYKLHFLVSHCDSAAHRSLTFLSSASCALHRSQVSTRLFLSNLKIFFASSTSPQIYVTDMTVIHTPLNGCVNYSSTREHAASLVGVQLVVSSDDGHIVTWNANSLRAKSEELYRKRHTEKKAPTNAEILLDAEWQENR